MKLGDIPGVVLTFVFVAVLMVAGFLVLSGMDSDLTADSYAANASTKIQEGLDNITDYASTWGTIVGVAVLLGIVIGGFSFGRSQGWI